MKVFLTKYVLTRGVVEADVIPLTKNVVREPKPGNKYSHHSIDEWYLRRDEAVARAYVKRDERIASLRNEIARLEKLEFS